MANIIIGCDGTWNQPDQMDRGRSVPSNVVKILRALAEEDAQSQRQVRYYDTGVGTAGFIDKYRGGIIGNGLFCNMRQAYAWLIEHYQPGDQLYLFGFSRGAFTVRSLAAMLGLCGIPDRQHIGGEITADSLAIEAAQAYRTDDAEARLAAGERFRARYGTTPTNIHVLGVWDTVGALGMPTRGPLGKLTRRRHDFHNVSLGANVRHAYHALAINERRRPFEAALWRGTQAAETKTVIQAWFAGVHSNIGGGYADAGLSDRTLYWMIRNAQRNGLAFSPLYIRRRIDPNYFGELRDSMQLMYRTPLTGLPAWRPIGNEDALGECIHFSAVQRWRSVSSPEPMPENLGAALETDSVPILRDEDEAAFHLKQVDGN